MPFRSVRHLCCSTSDKFIKGAYIPVNVKILYTILYTILELTPGISDIREVCIRQILLAPAPLANGKSHRHLFQPVVACKQMAFSFNLATGNVGQHSKASHKQTTNMLQRTLQHNMLNSIYNDHATAYQIPSPLFNQITQHACRTQTSVQHETTFYMLASKHISNQQVN